MRTEHLSKRKIVALLIACAVLLCSVAAGSVLVYAQAAARNSKGKTTAKSSQSEPKGPPSLAQASAANPSDTARADDDGPSPGNFLGSTIVPSVLGEVPAGPPWAVKSAAVQPPPTPKPADAGADVARQQINNETANLLAMAYALKAEVDKTNKDQLSISVVRKASQIEQLARKVRDEMRPVLSKN